MTKKSPDANIFPVETRFQKMALRPGGLTREQAIGRAQARVDELKPAFDKWLTQNLQEFVAAVRDLEAHPASELRREIAYSQCSQLRDVGSTMGYELLTFIAENVCKHLESVRAGAAYHKEAMDCHIDAIVLAAKPPYATMKPEQLPEITGGLMRVMERAKTPNSA